MIHLHIEENKLNGFFTKGFNRHYLQKSFLLDWHKQSTFCKNMKQAWNPNKLRIDFLSKSTNNRWGCEMRWGNDAQTRRRKKKYIKSFAWFILRNSNRIINSKIKFSFLLTGFKKQGNARPASSEKLFNPKLFARLAERSISLMSYENALLNVSFTYFS